MFLRKGFNITILALAAVFTACSLSFAGIAVTPERHILELMPGEEKTVDYKIYNDGPEDIHIKIDVKEWAKSLKNKDININSWLFIDNKEFDVKVGATESLSVRAKAPDKSAGEIVAMVFLCYKEEKDSPLNLRYGNPLYLLIKGTQKYDAKINKIDCVYFKDSARDNRNCLQFLVDIKNTGNIHIKPDIKIDILDKDNNALNQLEIKDGYPIFSGQSYKYALEWWDAELTDGFYKANLVIGYQDKIKLPEENIKFEFTKGKVKLSEKKKQAR